MARPKPVSMTQVTAANYKGIGKPQPLVIVGAGNVGQAGLATKQSAITDVTTADATDAATAVTLANANKAKINAILAALRSAGVIAP